MIRSLTRSITSALRKRSRTEPVQPKSRHQESEEQAFYAAQEEAFGDLRSYHAARRKRES